MLAGLLFAVRDAEDRPDRLAATLPFAGSTLIEYQARLLISAGASQIVIVVAKLTPDLLGAIGRVGKRGVAVDAVRNATEAAEKLHPLSRVLMLADGLVTTEELVRPLAGEGADTLLVAGEEEAGPEFERIGGRLAWAGAARLSYARLREAAAMPRDYDLQSALLRVASQAGAAHLLLPPNAAAEGHGLEHRAAALDMRSRTVLAGAMSGARGWFDRWVVAPIARLALPRLVARGVPSAGLALAGGVSGAVGLAGVYADYYATGLFLSLLAVVVWALGATLAKLRDELRLRRGQDVAAAALPALAALLLGARLTQWTGEATGIVLAIGVVTLAGLAERAISGRERLALWGGPGAYLLILLIASVAGGPSAGLALAAVYAAATLGAAVEALRRQA